MRTVLSTIPLAKTFCVLRDAHAMIAIPADVDPKEEKASGVARPGVQTGGRRCRRHGKVFVNLVDKNEVAVVERRR